MKRAHWLVLSLVVGIAGIAAFHPLGEGSAAAEASTGIGVLGLASFVVLSILTLRARRSTR